MSKATFWSRIGEWFRSTVAPWDDARTVAPQTLASSMSSTPPPAVPPQPSSFHANETFERTPLTDGKGHRGGLDSPAATQVETAQLAGLLSGLREQLDAYGDRFETLVIALQRLAEGLERLPEVAQTEVSLLGQIGEDAASGAAGIKRLADTLAQLPHIADAVRETSVAVGRGVERSRESADKTMTSLDMLTQQVTQLLESNHQSGAALKQLRVELSQGEQRVALLLERQAERFTWFAASVAAASILGLLVGLIAILRG